ncbi:SirB2 family protein [Sphaerotilus mobilis]|uniref:Putative membrane protein SirB2 n=1 Tax=Sphaerotilus mobilis TaxID=47994 RepID=A0A4Q7LQN2_9BURK|nr:SirB2 family protein [Sphaerotilus mobilis]RZS57195.1 putative membrane protein SirB2 [Sphaerotilus mobilis]
MASLDSLFGVVYPGLRQAHIGLVYASVGVFSVRWLATLAGARWPMANHWRHTSMVIDTLLLTAGATLWVGLGLNPLVQHWLGVKLLLLVAYIVLGTFALRRARSWLGKAICGLAALAVLVTMFSIARRHDPAGWLRGVIGHAPDTFSAPIASTPVGARPLNRLRAAG